MMVKRTKKTIHAFQKKRVRRTVACEPPNNIKEEEDEEKRVSRTIVCQPPNNIKEEEEEEEKRVSRTVVCQSPNNIKEEEDEEKRVSRTVVCQPPNNIKEEEEEEEEKRVSRTVVCQPPNNIKEEEEKRVSRTVVCQPPNNIKEEEELKRLSRTVVCQPPNNIKEEEEEEKRVSRTVVCQPPNNIKEEEEEKRVSRTIVCQPPNNIKEEEEEEKCVSRTVVCQPPNNIKEEEEEKRVSRTIVCQPPNNIIEEEEEEEEKRVSRTVVCQPPNNIREEEEEEKRVSRTIVCQPPNNIKEEEKEEEKRVSRTVPCQPPINIKEEVKEEVDVEEAEEAEVVEEEEDVQCIERESEWSPAESSDEEYDTSSTDSEADAPFLQEGGDTSLNNADLSEGGRWNDVDDPFKIPPQPTFRPTRPPGPLLAHTASYTALQFFQLFFTNSILQTITQNTNDYGSINSGISDPWIDLTSQDMYSFMSIVVYMGVVKCCSLTDYWRKGKLHSFRFPRSVMTCAKFLRICRALHLSSPAVDAANKQRRGTAAFDPFCKMKPLYQEMRDACIRNYHPSQEIAIEERMLASKPHVEHKHYIKNKTGRWAYKIFELVDSRSRYTWDFFIYKKNFQENSGQGLGYDSVMELIDTRSLGTGYKLFVDHFFTSPTLFRDLLQRKIWACGTIHANRVGFPKTKNNSLDSKSPRGTLRWIRRDSLLFIQWRDTRDFFMCSTIHAAHTKERVQRSVKGEDGHWLLKDTSIPPAVKEYYLCAGPSVVQTESYKIPHKTQKWYKMLFYEFMDIAIMNAFLLHEDIAKSKGVNPLQQKLFRESLAEELAEAGSASTARHAQPPHPPRGTHHRPVHIKGHSTAGRLKCRHCQAKTPVKCSSCDVVLCFIPGRDCFNDWHVAKNM